MGVVGAGNRVDLGGVARGKYVSDPATKCWGTRLDVGEESVCLICLSFEILRISSQQ